MKCSRVGRLCLRDVGGPGPPVARVTRKELEGVGIEREGTEPGKWITPPVGNDMISDKLAEVQLGCDCGVVPMAMSGPTCVPNQTVTVSL